MADLRLPFYAAIECQGSAARSADEIFAENVFFIRAEGFNTLALY